MNLDLDFEIGWTPEDPLAFGTARLISGERDAIIREVRARRDAHVASFRESRGRQLDSFLLLLAVAGDAVDWTVGHINGSLGDDDEDKQFALYYETLFVLSRRALTTATEIYELLTNDLIAGAKGRLRTLEEIFLVAAILAVHGQPDGDHPDLVQRYREHHKVFARSLAEEMLASGNLGQGHALDEETLRGLETQRDRLVAAYGKEYKTLWGWAACLLPPRTKLTFGKLSELVEINLASSNSLGSRHVHASSEGWHEAVEQDSGFSFNYVATLTSGYLYMTLEAVIPIKSQPEHGDPDTTGSDWLATLHMLVLEMRT